MEKKIVTLMLLVLALGCSMAACGGKVLNSGGDVEASKLNTEKVRTQPSIYDLAIWEDIQIDESKDRYFNGDARKAIKNMEPMLMSAARAVRPDMGTVMVAGNENSDYQWHIIQGLIAAYGVDTTNKTESYVTMNLDMVAKYFISCFADFKLPVPDLPEEFSTTLDSETSEYKIPVLDVPFTYFTVKEITLSKASSAADPTMSATISIELSDPAEKGKPAYGTAEVEVVKNPNSVYGYSLQSITYTKANE
ncbi:hypothetical protein [Aminipila sp.]|uniref:hypothetical protein n=1 Tax=Aminipila sp. TaxID=2060095 RepID=UPI0028979792|nr:hypothetical protein [Aminipila sp.]